jgi:hypothetical protein
VPTKCVDLHIILLSKIKFHFISRYMHQDGFYALLVYVGLTLYFMNLSVITRPGFFLLDGLICLFVIDQVLSQLSGSKKLQNSLLLLWYT